jgi:MarR family transcriptional regulator for hemolysin
MSTAKQFSETLHEWTHTFMHRSFRDFKRFMDSSGLSASQANALMRLYHSAGCGVSDLGEHVGISNAAASQMIDRLVQMGMVERTEKSADRRVKHLALTAQGRTLVVTGIEARSHWMEELTEVLNEDQQAEISAALAQLIEAAQKLEQQLETEIPERKPAPQPLETEKTT